MLVWVITTAKVDKVDRKALRAPTGPNGNRRPRRSFRPEYKLAVLAEYDRCNDHGQRGALLRREGLYSIPVVSGLAPAAPGGFSSGLGGTVRRRAGRRIQV